MTTLDLGNLIEALVAALLVVTIVYCVILNRRLTTLHLDEQQMKVTIRELIGATEAAERSIAGLKVTARDAEQALGQKLREAVTMRGELQSLIQPSASAPAGLSRPARPSTLGQTVGAAAPATVTPRPATPVASAYSPLSPALHGLERILREPSLSPTSTALPGFTARPMAGER